MVGHSIRLLATDEPMIRPDEWTSGWTIGQVSGRADADSSSDGSQEREA